MRKFCVGLLVVLAAIVWVGGKQNAHAQNDTDWRITDFETRIDVSRNAVLNVTETIHVDFGNLEKHGIYRTIPLNYNDNYGQSYKLRFELKGVTRDDGSDIPYSLSGFGTKTIKIGDADQTVSGKQSYVIRYEIERGIRFLETDELYWNATGNDWPVPIDHAIATITYPDNASNIQTSCFAGPSGSQAGCTNDTNGNIATFSVDNLGAYEGLTIVAGAPTGTLVAPTAISTFFATLYDNLPYLVIPIALVAFFFIWWQLGRDPKTHRTIVPEFAPPGDLSPSMMGLVKDEKVDMLDVSVAIIHLASRGFLTIEETTKKKFIGKSSDYKFTKIDTKQSANSFDRKLLEAIFGDAPTKNLSDLKNHFYTHLPKLKDELYNEAVRQDYFAKNPNSIRTTYVVVGVLVPFGLGYLLALISSAWMAFAISSGVIVPFAIWFGMKMPRKTVRGTEMWRQIQGFRLFINTAERYREKFNEDHNIFSKYLPYAMVFGLTKKWAKAFDGLKVEPPTWYSGYHSFNPIIFADSMTHASTNMNSTLISSPSSSGSSGFGGGGFSGGGFGGGGGGSW